MPLCFFVTRTETDLVPLPPDKVHHVHVVLRMPLGEPLVLHDGAGFAADAVLESASRKEAVARVVSEWRPVLTEPDRRITVLQALPRIGEKAEQILRHGTEIGAVEFVFFASEYATALAGVERIARKLTRWEEIARNAAEQSGRGIVPPVSWEPTLEGALARAEGTNVVLAAGASATLDSIPDGPLSLFVGPESGLTGEEIAAIGGLPVSLGPRILRTETAALAALARILL